MDDTLSIDTAAKTSSTEWQFRAQSDGSMSTRFSRLSIQQNLHVISTHEIKSKRPQIPATFLQKLSFFSMYTCNVGKLEILCRQQNNVNRFFWFYISNVLCKSLPMTYVYLFLSLYAPDYHLFISKMVPICYGCNWIFAITGIFQVLAVMNGTILYFIYFFLGIMHKLPWKRCDKVIQEENMQYNCYDLSEFAQKFENSNITYDYYFYSSEVENFTLAQLEFFEKMLPNFRDEDVWTESNVIFSLMWLLTAFGYRQLYKKLLWKILYYSHMALCVALFAIFVHVAITYEHSAINEIVSAEKKETEYLMSADFDLLAESMTGPPIIHLINSRSINQIKPSFGSGIIAASNAVMYIFKALTSYLMERHCERWVNATIILSYNENSSSFFLWPIYFATIYFGDFFVLIFFAINGIVNYSVALLTYHCVVETIRSEWKWIRSWCVDVVILLAAFLDITSKCHMIVEFHFMSWTAISTLIEAIIIFWMYPLSRFVDDIMFHYGTPPTKLRVLNFQIVPIFYLVKMYIMFSRFFKFDYFEDTICYLCISPRTAIFIHCTLFSIGVIFAIYHHVYKRKKGLNQLFKPVPEWGPKDYYSRQLRKQFDSNEFIASQAPRELSRHLIEKAELRSYKVDVQYNGNSRRSIWRKSSDKIA